MKLEQCKVGQRVAVYDSNRFIGKIVEVKSYMMRMVVSVERDDGARFNYHNKQLRLLVKKPRTPKAPRVLWINYYSVIQMAVHGDLKEADRRGCDQRIEGRAVRYVRARDQMKGRP